MESNYPLSIVWKMKVHTVFFLINGFTRAAFMDLGETPNVNDLMLVTGPIRTSRHCFTSHVGIGSTPKTALYDLFSNRISWICKTYLSMAFPLIKYWNGTDQVHLILTEEVIKIMAHIFIGVDIIWKDCLILCNTLFTTLKTVPSFPLDALIFLL